MSSPDEAPIRLLYFAWVREKVGRAEETVSLPPHVAGATVADLVEWLTSRGPEFEDAFARPHLIRVAVDRTHVKPNTSIAGAREIAFFPPVTGG